MSVWQTDLQYSCGRVGVLWAMVPCDFGLGRQDYGRLMTPLESLEISLRHMEETES